MSKTIAKLGQTVTVATSATEKDIAATVAKARGDNAKVSAVQLEGVILRASSSYADLVEAVRNCQHSQKEVQQRAFAARWYAMDYMDAVKAGKVKEARDTSGNVIIPAMDEKARKRYVSLLAGAKPDAKGLKENQVRCTKEQWQRRSTLRTWWTRLLGAAGVLTVETRGGARVQEGKAKVAKGAHDGALKTGKPAPVAPVVKDTGSFAVPVAVRVDTPKAAGNYYYTMAKAMLQFTTINAKPFKKGVAAPAAKFEKLVRQFHEKVAKLAHEADKAASK